MKTNKIYRLMALLLIAAIAIVAPLSAEAAGTVSGTSITNNATVSTIALDTKPGEGTTFRIVLPLTLATFRGVLVRAADRMFIIPAVSVQRVALVAAPEIRTVEASTPF